MSTNKELEKKLKIGAWVITALVLILVGLMRRPEFKIPLPDGVDLSFLPPFHATVNALLAIVLVMALYFVKQKNIEAHRKMIFVAMGLSILFLLSYVAYHFTTFETLFGDANKDGVVDAAEKALIGSTRTIYLLLLISHITLAGISLPFILFTFIKGFTNQVDAHKRMARWVWPIWFYVAVTGPICYLMLKPYY